MKRLVYVAGAYSAPSFSAIHSNIWKAREYAIKIWELGAVAICPHLNTFHFEADTKLTQEVFYDGDFAILKVCAAIFMMPGWEKSKGAVMEKEFSEREKIPIFYGIDMLQSWVRRSEGEAAPRANVTTPPVGLMPSVLAYGTAEGKPHVALRANSLSKEANAILQELLPCIKKAVSEALAERRYGPVA